MARSPHTSSSATTSATAAFEPSSEENVAFETSASAAGPPAHATGRLLRRAEAARMLGVSKSTLRRMEGTELQPTIGPHNIRMFHEEEVRAVVVTRRGRVETGADAGELAADAFELFDNGLGVVDAVKQLRAAPEIVESLHSHWARLRKNMLISAAGRSAICMTLIGYDDGSLRTEADVVAFLKKWVMTESVRQCWQCKGELACFCRECAKQWGLREAVNQFAEAEARKL